MAAVDTVIKNLKPSNTKFHLSYFKYSHIFNPFNFLTIAQVRPFHPWVNGQLISQYIYIYIKSTFLTSAVTDPSIFNNVYVVTTLE